MNEYTPGPWMVKTGRAHSVVYSGAYAVAVGCKESDARLIAAAPAMLDALRMAEGCIASYRDHESEFNAGALAIHRHILAVIQSAEGGDNGNA